MLTIAHRLATTDQIIVLNDHKIAELTHGELLSNSGLYARIYQAQFGQQQLTTNLTPD